ncbi:hypothetical protein BC829DRAFT_382537, partial [Chytridium lagenaria]
MKKKAPPRTHNPFIQIPKPSAKKQLYFFHPFPPLHKHKNTQSTPKNNIYIPPHQFPPPAYFISKPPPLNRYI